METYTEEEKQFTKDNYIEKEKRQLPDNICKIKSNTYRVKITNKEFNIKYYPTFQTLEKAIENKFFCPTKFAQQIEELVQINIEMNYIDAIIYFCEQNSVDLESVPKLISKPLKDKIKFEAMELNFLKKTSRAKLVF